MYSITLTSAPKRLYTEPNSKPITPPPITTKCFGISGSFKASVEVIILSLSNSIKGKEAGLDPVAIIMLVPSIVSSDPSFFEIFTWVVSTKDPIPSKTSILFLSIKYFIPPVVCSTTLALRSIIFPKSIFGGSIKIPCSSKCFTAS